MFFFSFEVCTPSSPQAKDYIGMRHDTQIDRAPAVGWSGDIGIMAFCRWFGWFSQGDIHFFQGIYLEYAIDIIDNDANGDSCDLVGVVWINHQPPKSWLWYHGIEPSNVVLVFRMDGMLLGFEWDIHLWIWWDFEIFHYHVGPPERILDPSNWEVWEILGKSWKAVC